MVVRFLSFARGQRSLLVIFRLAVFQFFFLDFDFVVGLLRDHGELFGNRLRSGVEAGIGILVRCSRFVVVTAYASFVLSKGLAHLLLLVFYRNALPTASVACCN